MNTEFSFGTNEILYAFSFLALFVTALIFVIRKGLHNQGIKILDKENEKTVFSVSNRNKFANVDVFRYSRIFFSLGLALSLGAVVLFMNWEIQKKEVEEEFVLSLDEDFEVEVPRTQEPPPPPPPPPPPVTLILEVPDELILEDEEIEFVDQSIEENTEVLAPPVVEKEAAPPPPPPPPPPPEPQYEEIFKVVEEMARFPGCEDIEGSKEEKQKCAEGKLLEFMYANIRYPSIARENGISGTVVVQFVVEKDGTVSGAKTVRDIGGDCGAEAIRIVNLMNEKGKKWMPGKQRGRAVRVQFNLPVKFKLVNDP